MAAPPSIEMSWNPQGQNRRYSDATPSEASGARTTTDSYAYYSQPGGYQYQFPQQNLVPPAETAYPYPAYGMDGAPLLPPREEAEIDFYDKPAAKVPIPPQMKPQSRGWELQQWAWEAFNTCVLLVAIVAVVVTLHVHDGQPLPQWPLSITINALLAIYVFIMKASMALILGSCVGQLQWSWYRSPRSMKDMVHYHWARFSPIGSFAWLIFHQLRQPLVALAALITILSIAVDPFIQQLAQTADCTAPLLGAQASVARTNYLGYESVPSSLQASVISGFYATQNLSDFDCSTGNCTFSNSYSTLGFCSSCADVSSNVTITEECLVTSDGTNFTAGVCDANRDPLTVSWNLTTTASPFSSNFYYETYNLTVDSDGMYVFGTPEVFKVAANCHTLDLDYQTACQGMDMGIIMPKSDTAIFRDEASNWDQPLVGCDDASTNNTWYCRGYGAAKCSLGPCVRSYSASIAAGQISEVLLDESPPSMDWGFAMIAHNVSGLTEAKSLFGLLDTDCPTEQERQELTTAGYDMTGTDRWLAYNITFDPSATIPDNSSSFPESLFAHGCVYIIDQSFINQLLEDQLSSLLLGSVDRYHSETATSNAANSFTGSQQLLYMFDSGNVNMTGINLAMDNVAQALTLWVRANGYANYSDPAAGHVFHTMTCLEVHWAWLTLPAVLALLALLVLVLTVVTTARQGLPVWKASPLPLLLHGPAGKEWVDDTLIAATASGRPVAPGSAELSTQRGMENLADKVWVRLVDDNQELRLRQVGVVKT
ncbi:hypothetical protein BX600DRAFT_2919 [Xylariales sp. PMI_506]|nr:hypothetical protein BX600DRAFT_2919 [Xylariales sp. PMI_506]